MKIYLMYILIILVNIIIFTIIKDKIKALRLIGIITISSAILLLVLALISKIIITNTITTINLSLIINYLSKKIIKTSLILFLVGLIEIIISKYFYVKRKI